MSNSTGFAHAGTVWADTGSHVPTRNDPPLASSTTKTLLSGAPGQGQGSSPHYPGIYAQMYHNIIKRSVLPLSRTLKLSPLFLSLHLCLSPALSGESVYPPSVGIVQLLRKCTKCFLLSSVEPFPSSVELGELYRKPLCSPLKMSTWIWSSCIANNHKCGLELRYTHSLTREGRNITFNLPRLLQITKTNYRTAVRL